MFIKCQSVMKVYICVYDVYVKKLLVSARQIFLLQVSEAVEKLKPKNNKGRRQQCFKGQLKTQMFYKTKLGG